MRAHPLRLLSSGLAVSCALLCNTMVEPGPGADASTVSIASLVASMTPAEKAGEMLMIPASSTGTSLPLAALERYRFGSVILIGNSGASPAHVLAIVARLQAAASPRGSLLISTDQEGGAVQRLAPPGFSKIPTALYQGTHMTTASLRSAATVWGRQMKQAGVNLDLAPVLDVVPGNPRLNPPIGYYQREYGSTPSLVVAGSEAFAAGLSAAGVQVVGKHFPGLGLVRANTDTTNGVTDTTIRQGSPYLIPFQRAVTAGFRFMMVSTADYQRLDPGVPAAFSHKIVTGLLRKVMGFRGVVVSDSLNAVQVRGYAVGTRAIDFVRAGGDLIVTTDVATAIQMEHAIANAQSFATFRTSVNAAVTRILLAKQAMGLPL